MLKLFFILLIGSVNSSPIFPAVLVNKREQANKHQSIEYNLDNLKDTSAQPISQNANNTDEQRNVLQEVLFATNEDCDLYINGVFKSTVTKNAHKFIKLTPGNYNYQAKSKISPDQMDEHFAVKEGKSNEVFIDLLYFTDTQNQLRANLKGKSTGVQTINATEKKQTSIAPQASVSIKNGGIEKQVADVLLTSMVPIVGGSFIMGNNKAGSEDEAEHTVTISAVQFNKYEVTQQQWEEVMGYNPSENKDCKTCPVENVSWEEVMKFIKKINTYSNKKFRLPTEAEWEYVARLGGKEEIEKAGGVEDYIRKTTWYFGNSDKKTHPVGTKMPTASGVYDLLGNVSEWCSDWYNATYFKEESGLKDPEGPPLGKEKVTRGGNYEDYKGDRFRPSLRGKVKPTEKSKLLGFRLVMDM